MESIKFTKSVIDTKNTGLQIKKLRKECGFTVSDIQNVFGFEYPQAVYSWEQGKNIPAIDNLLVLAQLFQVAIEDLIVVRNIETDIQCSSETAKKICGKKCNECKWKKTA